jgi:hypothetical protein
MLRGDAQREVSALGRSISHAPTQAGSGPEEIPAPCTNFMAVTEPKMDLEPNIKTKLV